MKKYLIIILLFSFVGYNAISQEIVTGLFENPVIKKEISKHPEIIFSNTKSSKIEKYIPVNLPFFDDFSSSGIYPDTSQWIDNEVFINNSYQYFPANRGVATLDAINSMGSIYSDASSNPFIADHLTSRPIRLDSIFTPIPEAISVRDSIYFSFFYQPQGRANAPESHDSLILEFGHYSDELDFAYVDSISVAVSEYITSIDTIFPGDILVSPCDNTVEMIITDTLFYDDFVTLPCDSVFYPKVDWTQVWSSQGMPLDTFLNKYGTYCKQVMIPITDSLNYLREDFNFRFYNYASLASDVLPSWRSNADQWNIDYVYLNIGRSMGDSTYRDISFVERAPSMLDKYESMPYNQYRKKPVVALKDTLKMYISNLDNTTFNTNYKYTVSSKDGSFSRTYNGGNCNLPPFYEYGFQNCEECQPHACPPNNTVFPLGLEKDSAVFTIEHVILGDFTTTDTISDTIIFNQKFYNYYAYDDGTAEEGYGLTPAGAMLAYRFQLNEKDTLRAVRMFFNKTFNYANEQYFDLCVWNDNNGKPGEVLHKKTFLRPVFSDSLNKFHTYYLDSILPLNNVFYIGWIQFTEKNLNLGFDRNNDAMENIMYNCTGEWLSSIKKGALMMRPVLGKQIHEYPDNPPQNLKTLYIYPNPASGDNLNFKILPYDFYSSGNYDDLQIEIYNLYGQLVLSSGFDDIINISSLKKGMYIVKVINTNNKTSLCSKLIVSR
ncbi:MAG: T9SS type A sorting domain-containing protein [Bacteroidales bacterium]|nr:T9SS type A sorting domain-containing protein [Bacteroidales bacterium]